MKYLFLSLLAVLFFAVAATAQSPVFGLAGTAGSPVFWAAQSGSPVYGLPATLPSNLILGLPMNDGSGLILHDVSVNADNATLSGAGAVTWQSNVGFPGTTTLWSGTGNAVVSNPALVNFDGTKPFSVTVWVKATSSSSQQTLVGTLNPPANFMGWEVQNGDGAVAGKLQFLMLNSFMSNGIWVTGNTTINDGATHYLAVV